jgi:GT2 family glycosyltransferase
MPLSITPGYNASRNRIVGFILRLAKFDDLCFGSRNVSKSQVTREYWPMAIDLNQDLAIQLNLDQDSAAPTSAPVPDARPAVVVGVVTYNSSSVIARTLDSILAQDYLSMTVMVCDNASADGTAELVREHYPWVTLVVMPENRGPNAARNRILDAAGDGMALILDDDCMPTPDMLGRLVDAAMAHPEAAGFGARVVYDREPDRIQFDGSDVHFVGEAVHHDCERRISEVDAATRPVGALGGGCQLIRAEPWRQVGGFDESLFFGREDGEFSQRLAIAGYQSFIVPSAVVRHAVEPRGLKAGFHQIRNRWLVILGLYRLRTLLLIAPALLVHELVIALFMIMQGSFGIYVRGNLAVLRSLPAIRAKRRQVAAFRRSPDRAFLTAGPIAVRQDLLACGGLAQRLKTALDGFYAGYWRLVRPFV